MATRASSGVPPAADTPSQKQGSRRLGQSAHDQSLIVGQIPGQRGDLLLGREESLEQRIELGREQAALSCQHLGATLTARRALAGGFVDTTAPVLASAT